MRGLWYSSVEKMRASHQHIRRPGFRAFMVKHQYKILLASMIVGLMWFGVYRLLAASWFFSRLSLLLAIITRRSPRTEKIELTVMAVLWAVIFVFVVVVVFWPH